MKPKEKASLCWLFSSPSVKNKKALKTESFYYSFVKRK
ncbi:hypothetical protein VPMS16_3477 [Vibrio sp. 16]|nr:hypothetical protein VPMS16_3477 [Vibrio sp. 16]